MTPLWAIASLLATAQAGGGPANVLILFNQESIESDELAHYYRDERFIPYTHLCPVTGVDPEQTTISFADYDSTLRYARDICLDALSQAYEIHTLVLVRGLPYLVELDDGSTTSVQAMLQVGETTLRSDASPLAGSSHTQVGGTWQPSVPNPAWIGAGGVADFPFTTEGDSAYQTASTVTAAATQPAAFTRRDMDDGGTWDFSNGIYLVSRIDGFDYADAYALIDAATAAEGTPPTAPITCMAAADDSLSARDSECAYTVQMLDAVGVPAQWLSEHDATLSDQDMAAYLTGATALQDAIAGNTFAPGALAFNLAASGADPAHFFCDSTGSTCPETETNTAITRFIRAGATGAHGMVADSPTDAAPGASALLFATMGYSLIESALFTQPYLYWQNLYLGDPLSAPWATRPEVTLDADIPHYSNEPVHVAASHPRGIASLTLYVNGRRVAAITDAETLTFDPTVATKSGAVHPPMSVELLAVAVANNAEIDRPGWPSSTTQPQTDVQGWTNLGTILISPPIDDDDDTIGDSPLEPEDETDTADPTDTGDPGGSPGDTGPDKTRCSCATSPDALPPWFVLLGLLIHARRRENS